jgi:ADP-ribose pyrophosphatase YjhB (NUDIX family)
MSEYLKCPQCKQEIERFKSPLPTVDIIIEFESHEGIKGIVLIYRKNPPLGWAIPGGYVDYGESMEAAALREAKEETSLDVTLIRQFHTYSNPKRDPRQHNISTVFIATAQGEPRAADDATALGIFRQDNLPPDIVFDHRQILEDYFQQRY